MESNLLQSSKKIDMGFWNNQFLNPLNRPGRCALCHRWVRGWVCADCRAQFDVEVPRCPRCALRVHTGSAAALHCTDCQWREGGLTSCAAVVSYEYPWSTLLARYKYGEALGFAPLMVQMARKRSSVLDLVQQADLILGMPLTPERIKERGYNQAHEWAKRLDSLKTRSDVLLRFGHLSAQAGLGRSARQQRLSTLMGSFQVDPYRQHWVKQCRVLLIDDVQTTGATLHAAAAALRRAGAQEVYGLVFARAERSGVDAGGLQQ